ncbi:hypothetical protein GQ44DRAFT_768801 [Phaeosphaeriaceae sp. PMI808]|nr:hypothetical protein GQ44DRAFT_768801 [Phaeosphaeriaceae sp. PMI808]
MCILDSTCTINQEECHKSYARFHRGAYFPGEDRHNFREMEEHMRFIEASKSEEQKEAEPEEPGKNRPTTKWSYDLLAFNMIKQSEWKKCIICNNVEARQLKVHYLEHHRALGYVGTPAQYKVKACSDYFHEACLYSFITEASELNFITCRKCECLRIAVKLLEWNILEIGVAMDRIK